MVPAHKTKIMIHCLATSREWGVARSAEQMVDDVRRWHVQERGWSDIAYAEIIGYDGDRAKGRDLNDDGNTWDDQGAGARGHNADTIHLALAGGRGGNAFDGFEAHFTRAQEAALLEAIDEINTAAGRKLTVIGHNDVAAKACPCFDARAWWAERSERAAAKPSASQPSSAWAAIVRAIANAFSGGKA